MTNALLWLGPVSTSNIADSVPAGFEVKTYNHGQGGGVGSAAFRDWALSLGPDPLSTLAPGASRVLLCGFSAAHGAHEVILARAAATQDMRLIGVLGADAYYTSHESAATPKPGHLAWLSWVLKAPRGRFAVFTTSDYEGGAEHPSPSSGASFAALADALHLAPRAHPIGVPPPELTGGRGPVRWCHYGKTLEHVQHATEVAPAFLANVPAFRYAGQARRETSTAANLLYAAALVGAAWYAHKQGYL